MRNKENCSVFHNGYVYGFSEDAGLRCVDFATGAVQWTNGAFGTESALIMANGELVAISGKDGSSPANGSLVVFQANPAAYTELHRQDNILGLGSGGWTWTAPTVANGKLYLRGHGGLLVCYDVTPLPQITVASSPSGRTFTVDGGSNATAPQTYSWGSATNHTLATTSPQGSGGTRYVFASWTYASSTNTNLSFSYAVPASDQTVTANFGTEHQLTTAIAGDAPAGTVTPASGSWHAANSDISVLATPAAATSAFDGWSGALTGRQNPGSLRMSGPRSVTATFRTDTDMDGMPDYWETLFALNPNDSGDAGTDADGDGDTNVEEYQASTNPKVDDGAADEGDGASGLSCTQGRSDAAGLLVLCLALAAVARRRLLRA
jgi:hypothetical protein